MSNLMSEAKMNTEKMIELLRVLDESVVEMIDAMTTQERKDLYLAAKASGVEVFPRNIYYNYSTQEWTMPEVLADEPIKLMETKRY